MRILLLSLYRDDYYDRAGEEEEDGMPNNTVEVIIEKPFRRAWNSRINFPKGIQ